MDTILRNVNIGSGREMGPRKGGQKRHRLPLGLTPHPLPFSTFMGFLISIRAGEH